MTDQAYTLFNDVVVINQGATKPTLDYHQPVGLLTIIFIIKYFADIFMTRQIIVHFAKCQKIVDKNLSQFLKPPQSLTMTTM